MGTAPAWGDTQVDDPNAPTCPVPTEANRLGGALTLRDGEVVSVRPIRADDVDRLIAFHARLSPEAIAFRYFSPVPKLTTARATWLTHVDYENRMALVATIGPAENEQIIGVVRYERTGPTFAEVAFLVEDHWQGQGIATQLLYRLAEYGRRHDFVTFLAEIMGSNNRMRDVTRYAGFPFTTKYQNGTVEVCMDITKPPTSTFAPKGELLSDREPAT
jgi:RimJ/RimL family protein N-acetyltransferase